MIIFDLDGTLADCEHRRHFVDPLKAFDNRLSKYKIGNDFERINLDLNGNAWKPDYQSFNQACDKDQIILPVVFQFYALREKFGACHPIQIWSGRCESVKGKTIDWLQRYFTRDIDWVSNLKMRPIGDNTPDHELKERWLDESLWNNTPVKECLPTVFDSDLKSIAMWKRRSVFVFNCSQSAGDES